jgi:hypothetical protein
VKYECWQISEVGKKRTGDGYHLSSQFRIVVHENPKLSCSGTHPYGNVKIKEDGKIGVGIPEIQNIS